MYDLHYEPARLDEILLDEALAMISSNRLARSGLRHGLMDLRVRR